MTNEDDPLQSIRGLLRAQRPYGIRKGGKTKDKGGSGKREGEDLMRRFLTLQAAQPNDKRQDPAILPRGVEGEEREGLVDVVVEVLLEAV